MVAEAMNAIPALDVTRQPKPRKDAYRYHEGRHPELYGRMPKDRRCEHPGCITILSAYNRGPTCMAHTPPRRVTGAVHR